MRVTITTYAAWKVQNPGSMLLGARMAPGASHEDGRVWTLTFGVPGRSAFLVQTEQARAGAVPFQNELGEKSLEGRPMPVPPARPVTFGAMEARWKALLPAPENARTPNFAQWGLAFQPGGAYCPSTSTCRYQEGYFVGVSDYNDIYLGIGRPLSTNGRTFAVAGLECCAPVLFVGNASSGNTYGHFVFERDVGIDPLPVASTYEAPEPLSVPANDAPRPVSFPVEHGALAAGSLFLLFLVGYFLQALKFLGARLLVAVPSFAKLHKSELLNNRVRERIVQAVRSDPGSSPTQLKAATGAGWTTVVYHLSVLEKNKILTSLMDGRYRRYFPADTVNWGKRGRIAALRNARTKQLYDLLLDAPGLDRKELAQRLGVSRPATYWHVERLEKCGLVGHDKDGRRLRFFPQAEALAATSYDLQDAVEVS